MFLIFFSVFLSTAMFVGGTVLLVRALGAGSKGNSLQAAFSAVLGLGLKFPAIIVGLKIGKDGSAVERNVAMGAVVLVYFVSVVGASVYGFRQNRKDQ